MKQVIAFVLFCASLTLAPNRSDHRKCQVVQGRQGVALAIARLRPHDKQLKCCALRRAEGESRSDALLGAWL